MDALELASSLISFKSVAPPGNEGPCARFIGDALSDLRLEGAAVYLDRFERGRSNVVATFGGGPPGLLLAGHMDVVPADEENGWSSRPFEASIRNGRLFGRGSADMKSGLAAMISAIASLKGKHLKRSLAFVATAGEEIGFDGLHRLALGPSAGRIRSRLGVVGEPTEMKVVRAHRGSLTCRVTFLGRSAHAGSPSLGVNSIENCTLFIEKLGPLRERFAATRDGDLGLTLVTPTVIAGGTKSNVIPGTCELTLDSRVTHAVGRNAVLAGLRTIIKELRTSDSSFRARLDVLYESPSLTLPEGSELVRMAESITGSKSGVAPYGSEAPVYGELGTPTLVLGPGSVKQAHIVDEFAEVKQIRRAESVYRRMIETVCL